MNAAFRNASIVPALALAALASSLLTGCDRLAHGAKIKPLDASEFFADGQSSRRPPAHSVAQNGLRLDSVLYAGRNADGSLATQFPWPVNEAVLARGRQQYLAICANCHAPDGYGQGIIVRRGFPQPPSYHIQRLLQAPVGHFYQVITHGYAAMYPYASIVDVNDRWAIIAYIRALQRSQHTTVADVPPDELANLQKGAAH
jgi:mono/diheme cytochrome c family protein